MIADKPLIYENETVMVNPEFLYIKEFKRIDKEYKDKDKKNTMFSCLYFIADYRSPYAYMSKIDRIKQVANDIIEDPKWRPDEMMVDAISKYIEMQTTPSLRLLEAAYVSVNSASDYFKDQQYKKNGRRVKDFDIEKMLSNATKLQPLIENIKKLSEQIKTEKEEDNAIKGGGQAGIFEDA